MLLDPETLDLAPRARDGARRASPATRASSPSCRRRSSRSSTPPRRRSARRRAALLAGARATLAARGGRASARSRARARIPSPRPRGSLSRGDALRRARCGEYGAVARRQLVFGLHVHVAVARRRPRARGLQRRCAPTCRELAALGANAPFYERRDTGLASVRPKLSRAAAAPGRAAGARELGGARERPALGRARRASCAEPRAVVVGARLHPRFGTVEVRVPDTQATVADDRRDRRGRPRAGRLAGRAPRRRRGAGAGAGAGGSRENRWSACRHGARGHDGGPRHRRARPDPRAAGARCSTSSRRRPTARLRGRARRSRARPASANGAARQRRVGGAAAPAAARAGSAGWRTRFPDGSAGTSGTVLVPARARGDASARSSSTLGGPPHELPRRRRRPTSPTRWATTTCTSRCTSATSCTTAACPGVDERWEWEPSLLALRAELEARLRGRAAARSARRGRRRSRPRDGPRAARRSPTPTTGRRCRATSSATGTLDAGARVRRAPLGLPAQGGRPALVGDPAAVRPAEGRAGRDPGRRVRRRAARARPRRSCSRRRWTALGLDAALRRLPRRHPRRDARHREPDVAVRAAPPLARRDRRAPRAVRDDLLGAQPPLRRRPAPARASAARATDFFDEHVEADAVHENIAAVDLAGGLARQEPGARRRRPLGRPGARRARGPLGAAPARRVGGGRASLLAQQTPAGRLAGDVAVLGAARRAEADELVRAVAERADARLAAAAQRDRLAPDRRSRCRPGRPARTGRGRAAGRRDRA